MLFSTVWSNESFKNRFVNQIFWSNQDKVKFIATYKNSHFWKHHYSAYLVFKNNPIFGAGNKNYRNACLNFSDETNALTLNKNKHSVCATHPHQIYYEFLSEHGILGLFFIIILTALYLNKFSQFKKTITSTCLEALHILYLHLCLWYHREVFLLALMPLCFGLIFVLCTPKQIIMI